MEHLYNYIQKNKADQLREAPVTVSLKVDGTPLQVAIKKGEITFHKKGKDEKTIGPAITNIDLFLNEAFYNAVVYLNETIAKHLNELDSIKIINFEILIPNEHHLIQYNQYPKNNICLLNAFTINDEEIKYDVILEYSKILDIGIVPRVFKGKLEDKLDSLVSYVNNHCNPKEPNYDNSFKDSILNILGSKAESPLFDTKNGQIEGFVFDFNLSSNRVMIKIDSPYFMQTFNANKGSEMDPADKKNMTTVMNMAIGYIDSYKGVEGGELKKRSDDQFVNLIENYHLYIGNNSTRKKRFASACSLCKSVGDKKLMPEVLPTKFSKYKDDSDWLLGARTFMWLFYKKRSDKGLLSKVNPYVKDLQR